MNKEGIYLRELNVKGEGIAISASTLAISAIILAIDVSTLAIK